MKKHFLTGLIILLPVAVTVAILMFIVNFITDPFIGYLELFFSHTHFYQSHYAFVHFSLQLLAILILVSVTVLLGLLARIVIFKTFLSLYDYFLHRIPIIKTIYKIAQQVIRTLFGGQSKSFQQVVMVPYPNSTTFSIGLVSGNSPAPAQNALGKKLVTVFVPIAPNPTSGFLFLYEEQDLIYLDMKVKHAIKFIISCGVLHSDEEHPDPLA